MAINANHPFEDLDGTKCAVVEKNCSEARVHFLSELLSINGFKVIVVNSPPPKAAPVKPAAAPLEGETSVPVEVPKLENVPETFTLGVTDVVFNVTNAIFGRLLKTKDGKVVTLAYWQEKENVSSEDTPYFEKKM